MGVVYSFFQVPIWTNFWRNEKLDFAICEIFQQILNKQTPISFIQTRRHPKDKTQTPLLKCKDVQNLVLNHCLSRITSCYPWYLALVMIISKVPGYTRLLLVSCLGTNFYLKYPQSPWQTPFHSERSSSNVTSLETSTNSSSRVSCWLLRLHILWVMRLIIFSTLYYNLSVYMLVYSFRKKATWGQSLFISESPVPNTLSKITYPQAKVHYRH